MQSNLSKIINNQDEVADMEKKSQNIQQSAFEMRSQSRKIELEARKRRCRLYLIIGGSILIVIFIIVMMFVGGDWDRLQNVH